MPKYLVERSLPGITGEQLKAAASRAKVTSAQMAEDGTPVRYLRSIFIPGEEKFYCLFDGPSSEVVGEANEAAEIPFERIFEAEQVAAEDV